jgi:hypothetical protein
LKKCFKALVLFWAIASCILWLSSRSKSQPSTAETHGPDPVAVTTAAVEMPPASAVVPGEQSGPLPSTDADSIPLAAGDQPEPDGPLSMEEMLAAPNGEIRIPGARHQVLGRDCHGELVFTDVDFRFECLGDSFTIQRTNVAKVDKNGVKLLTHIPNNDRIKFHFAVTGMRPDEVHDLFSKWFER